MQTTSSTDSPTLLEPAPIRARVAARVIDTVLLLVVVFGILGAAAATGDQTAVDAAVIVAAIGPFAYEWLFLGSRGQTLGRMRMGIAVREADSAGRISYLRALARILAYQLLAVFLVPLLVGVLSALRDPQRRTWHDRAAGTIVVRTGR